MGALFLSQLKLELDRARADLGWSEGLCHWVNGEYVTLDQGRNWYHAEFGRNHEVLSLEPTDRAAVERLFAEERAEKEFPTHLRSHQTVDLNDPKAADLLRRMRVQIQEELK